MIALVGLSLRNGGRTGVEVLPSLPSPPSLAWSAFLIGCGEAIPPAAAIEWCREARSVRPHLPIGVIADLDIVSIRTILKAGLVLDPLLTPAEVGGLVGDEVIATLQRSALEARVVEKLVGRVGATEPAAVRLLEAAASVGVRGHKTARLAAALHVSTATLARKLHTSGLPPAGILLRMARMLAVQIGRDLGMSKTDAVTASGWSTVKQYDEARRRAFMSQNRGLAD